MQQIEIDKKEVLLVAQNAGYFRAKDEAKREAIMGEAMFELDLGESDYDVVKDLLEAETLRRHVASQARAKRAIDKAQTDAAKPLTGGVDSPRAHVQDMPPGRYVLTTAQNNTDVDPLFLGALKTYCDTVGARLLVAKTTYNKTGFQQSLEDTEGVYYAPEIVPYLIEGQVNLGGKIDFCAQANVLPTAKNPLSGFEAVTLPGVDVVIPATKIALKCTAALKGSRGKILYATGAVTKRNYIMRKAGAVAATEHNIGALFVDTTNPVIIARQLERMNDSHGFYDDGIYYDADGYLFEARPTALQFGDIHAEKMEAANLEKMVGLINKFMPEHVILHDLLDFSSRNHHNVKDCAFMFKQTVQGNTVAGDLQTMARVLDAIYDASDNGDYSPTVHVIESNHDLAINTWLKNEDFKTDPVNATTYLRCMLAMYEHIEAGNKGGFNMLEFAYSSIGEGLYGDRVCFHETDESVILAGVEMGCHGHTGANGSRGSPQQFRALGVPMNTGHTHTPSILGACYTAGVAGSLEMGYNVGASSWQLANIVTWPNGQRQVIFM